MQEKTNSKPLYNSFSLFCVLIFIYLGIAFYMNNYSPTKELYYDSLRDNLSEIQIKTLIEQGHRYAWLGYVLLVLLVFLRVSITSAIIYTATTLADMKVRFKDLFSIALKADFIFIIPLVIQVIWINVTPKQLTLEDVQYFAPLSLLNLVNPKGIDALWIYPFQTLSVFEVAYGYYGLICASHFGRMVPAITVQMMPL